MTCSWGFTAGGLGVALNVGIYAAAGWYHVESMQFDLRALLVFGFLGYLWVGLWEEFMLRGVAFRLLERGLGSIAALAVSSVAFISCTWATPARLSSARWGPPLAAG